MFVFEIIPYFPDHTYSTEVNENFQASDASEFL